MRAINTILLLTAFAIWLPLYERDKQPPKLGMESEYVEGKGWFVGGVPATMCFQYDTDPARFLGGTRKRPVGADRIAVRSGKLALPIWQTMRDAEYRARVAKLPRCSDVEVAGE